MDDMFDEITGVSSEKVFTQPVLDAVGGMSVAAPENLMMHSGRENGMILNSPRLNTWTAKDRLWLRQSTYPLPKFDAGFFEKKR